MYADHQRRTCIAVQRTAEEVSFIRLSVELGLELEVKRTTEFDQEFKPMVDYPVERAARLYVSYAKLLGATEEALTKLSRFTTVTKEDTEMAKSKKASKAKSPGVKPTPKGKPRSKSGGKPASQKPKTEGSKKVERGPSAAGRFQELIREGKHTDDEIFDIVQKEFNLDDKKRSYVAWYRNFLKKRGEKVPEAKA